MKVFKRDITSSTPLEYLSMKDAVDYDIGQAIAASGDVAVLVTGSTVPTHICATKAAGVTGGFISAVRTEKDIVYEAPLTAAGTALKIGDKVTIAPDSIGATATTGGILEVTGFETAERAVGDNVYVRL